MFRCDDEHILNSISEFLEECFALRHVPAAMLYIGVPICNTFFKLISQLFYYMKNKRIFNHSIYQICIKIRMKFAHPF